MESSRLILRPWREEDAPALFRLASDPDTGPAAGWPPHFSVEESLAVLRGAYSLPESYAVLRKSDGALVGAVSLSREEGGYALGYWIGKEFRNRGFASEAADMLLERCFTLLSANFVTASCFEQNLPSLRVLEKLGFQRCSSPVLRADPVFGEPVTVLSLVLTREDWEQKASREIPSSVI